MSGESLTTTTTTTSWIPSAQRWLEELFEGDDTRTYTTFADDDDFEYTFETWQFFILVMIVAFFISCGIFYLSYRQEVCCGVHNNRSQSKNKNTADEDIETGMKLATKTFQDSRALDRLPDVEKNDATTDADTSSSSSDSSSSSSSHTTSDAASSSSSKRSKTYSPNKMQTLVSTPRCVLCSKAYEIGECITHCSSEPSSGVASCHHEFHERCLRKYWTDNKANAGKCPVCKIQYCATQEEVVMTPPSSSDSPPSCQCSSGCQDA